MHSYHISISTTLSIEYLTLSEVCARAITGRSSRHWDHWYFWHSATPHPVKLTVFPSSDMADHAYFVGPNLVLECSRGDQDLHIRSHILISLSLWERPYPNPLRYPTRSLGNPDA